MKELFYKYQKPLLKFANHPFGRKFLQLHTDKNIGLIMPNGIKWIEGDVVKGNIYAGGDRLALKLGLALTALDIASLKDFRSFLYYLGLANRPFYAPIIHFTNKNASTGDGWIQPALGTVWADARNATTGTATTTGARIACAVFSSQYYINRYFLPFDTSAITGTVTAAAIKLYRDATAMDALETPPYTWVTTQSTQPSITALANDDFNNLVSLNTPDEGASRITTNTTNFPANDWATVTLNATGIGWIGTTLKIVFRRSGDVDDVAPAQNGSRIGDFSTNADGTNIEYLTYTEVPKSALKSALLMGVGI